MSTTYLITGASEGIGLEVARLATAAGAAVLARGDTPTALGLMAEWASFALTPTAYIGDGERVVSLGRFTGVHGTSGKAVDAAYAHVWDVRDGKIQRFRQYIDTLAIAKARR